MSVQKEIKCSRCRKLKVVPSNWEYRECIECHSRTVRRNEQQYKHKKPLKIEKIEKKAIDSLVNFDNAWTRYKRFVRRNKSKGMSKEQFREQYFKSQSTKIAQIKAIIEKYNDKNAPILSHDCLRFRILLGERNQYVNTQEFPISQQDANFFYNHCQDCPSCSRYYAWHRDDAPQMVDLGDKEVTQKEFDDSLNTFWDTIKGKKRSIDNILDRGKTIEYDDGEI